MSYEAEILQENRRLIQLINPFQSIEFDEMTETEKKEYVAEASRVFNSTAFQSVIKHLTKKQIEFIGMESQSWEQTLLGRGNINGIGLVLERLKFLDGIHKDYIREQQEKEGKIPEE
jgi:hypothetical protein